MKPLTGSRKNNLKKLRNKKRDYHLKSFRNPFFVKRNYRVLKWQFNILMLLIILAGLTYLFSFSDLYIIKEVNIIGDKEITKQLIQELVLEQEDQHRYFIFSQNKLLFFDIDNLAKRIGEQLVLENLNIDKDYRHILNISFTEKTYQGLVLNQGQIFTIDSDSRIISIIEELPASSSMPIFSFDNHNLAIGDYIYDKSLFTKSDEIYRLWYDLGIPVDIQNLILSEDMKDINILTKDGWQIYTTDKYPYKEQLISLQRLLKEKEQELKNIKYIDLRIQGWIYYQ